MSDSLQRRFQRLINTATYAGLALIPIAVSAVIFWSDWGTSGRIALLALVLVDLALMIVPLLMARKMSATLRDRRP